MAEPDITDEYAIVAAIEILATVYPMNPVEQHEFWRHVTELTERAAERLHGLG